MKNIEGGKCPLTGLPVNTILLAIMLIGGGILGVSAYQKVSDIHTVITSSFGKEATFRSYLDLIKTDAYINQSDEAAQEQIDTIKSNLGIEETSEESTGTTSASVDTKVAMNDATWAANAKEAASLFDLQGTPGNVVLNVKTGKFQAVGGAYPQSTFEEVITALKTDKTDASLDAFAQVGKSGTLTADQITAVLSGTYRHGKDDATIVIVEYSDLLCPYCQRHYNDKTLENIVAAQADVAMVFKNNPIAQLHPTAPIGARGAECAGKLGGSAAFYQYIGEAFQYQTFTASNVVEIAGKIGLNADEFVACFNG